MNAWTALMHPQRGWLTRHPRTTLAIVFSLVVFSQGVIEWFLP